MYVFVRSDNPRPTFHLDMTPDERTVMERHVAYWSEQARLGVAVVFVPLALLGHLKLRSAGEQFESLAA